MLHRDAVEVVTKLGPDAFDARAATRAAEAAADAKLQLADGTAIGPELMLLLWRCVVVARTESKAAGAAPGELVATLPIGLPKGARPTNVVIREMLEGANVEVVAAGYDFTRAGGVIEQLAATAIRGASVRIVCDRAQGGAAAIRSAWPGFAPKPEVLVNVPTEDPLAKMHTKLLVVDRYDTLLTSANFTHHGLFGNIELGVRLLGAESAGAARAFIEHLADTKSIDRAAW